MDRVEKLSTLDILLGNDLPDMRKKLPENGIECVIVPRLQSKGKAISASTVRQAIKDGNWGALKELVPKTTLDYFMSPQAEAVIARIRGEENVVHY